MTNHQGWNINTKVLAHAIVVHARTRPTTRYFMYAQLLVWPTSSAKHAIIWIKTVGIWNRKWKYHLHIDFAYDSFEQTLQNVLDKHAPATKCARTVQPLSLWYNDEIKEARHIRRRLERKWQKHDTDENKKAYKEQHAIVNRLIQKAKECYYMYNEQLAATNNKQVFQIKYKLLNIGTKVLPSCDSHKEFTQRSAIWISRTQTNTGDWEVWQSWWWGRCQKDHMQTSK